MLKLKNLGVKFLIVKPAKVKQKVALISYANGVLSIDKGLIASVEGFNISYDMGGGCGSSGAPILTWEFINSAVGIHKSRGNISLGYIRYGTSLEEIIEWHILENFPIIKYCIHVLISNNY